jgi:hypothetical protein
VEFLEDPSFAGADDDAFRVVVGLPDRSATPAPRTPLVSYPFPLRDSLLVSVDLPADLSRREATRLAACIQTLAADNDDTETGSP